MIKSIVLSRNDGGSVALALSARRSPYTVEQIFTTDKYVYSDAEYWLRIDADEEISGCGVYLNNELISDYVSANEIRLSQNPDDHVIFREQIGFVQFVVCLTDGAGQETWFYSEYASVLVRPSAKNRAIDAMLRYIYENQQDILMRSTSVTGTGDDYDRQYDDFWSQIMLLEECAKVYEDSYGYFKANCRYKLEPIEVVDRVEKLQYIDAKTVQYTVQHPELLRSHFNGIKYGRQSFLPDKTLIYQNRMTQDIYENRVVVGFLTRLRQDAMELKKRIDDFIGRIAGPGADESGYMVSSYIILKNAEETLMEFKEKVDKVTEKFEYLFVLYRQIMDVSREDCTVLPKPSQVFLAVPQYNRIYSCIVKWFGKTGYDLSREQVMLRFFNAPSIYEAYVLVKLINRLKELGYALVQMRSVRYQEDQRTHREYNNTFVFEREEQRVTLYYEPFIYDEDNQTANGIALYRNNTISMPRGELTGRRGHYYTPDYLIKIEQGGEERYVICDAKYSREEKVRTELLPELAYKYLFSISPKHEHCVMAGMMIFYGITERGCSITSLYDKQGSRVITPFADLVPLSEMIPVDSQDGSLLRVVQKACG